MYVILYSARSISDESTDDPYIRVHLPSYNNRALLIFSLVHSLGRRPRLVAQCGLSSIALVSSTLRCEQDLPAWLTCPDKTLATATDASQLVFNADAPIPGYLPCRTLASLNYDSGLIGCVAFDWAAPIHDYTCTHVFPPNYDPDSLPLREVSGPDYYGRIVKDKVIESLLAKAG